MTGPADESPEDFLKRVIDSHQQLLREGMRPTTRADVEKIEDLLKQAIHPYREHLHPDAIAHVQADFSQLLLEQWEPMARAETAHLVGEEIRRELVCCRVHHVLQHGEKPGSMEARQTQENKHEICYWGEAAALIADEIGRGER